LLLLTLLAACGSSTTPPVEPDPAPLAATPVDAAIDAAPDAGPSPEVLAAAAYVFKFNTPDRKETWTLRWANGSAALDVATAAATIHYLGTVSEGTTLELDLTARNNQQKLSCTKKTAKYATRTCDKKAKPQSVEVVECKLPGYDAPMTLGLEPGLEFLGGQSDTQCNGYRIITP
jgi:hypothetical protein